MTRQGGQAAPLGGNRSGLRRALLCAGLLLLAFASGCRRQQRVVLLRQAAAPVAAPAQKSVAELAAEPRYQGFIRPLLARHGCASGNCHGANRGGGLYLMGAPSDGVHDLEVLLLRLDRKQPENSELIKKVLNKVAHNGGINLREGSCEHQRLLAWIGQRPDPVCQDPPPPDRRVRFARELVPALAQMGCSAVSCHGGSDVKAPAVAHLNLSALSESPPQTDRAYHEFERSQLNRFTAWASAVMKAADGVDGKHPKAIEATSCAYRRLYGYVADSPELTCSLEPGGAKMPSLEDLAKVVLPAIERRGCMETACHGGGAGDMTLFPPSSGPPAVRHDFMMFTARVEDFAKLDESTLLRTARNLEPHGGGRRLGGKGDCVDGIFVDWLSGKPVKACPPPEPLSYERYVTEIQPVIDKMTCSNPKCHAPGVIEGFALTAFAKDEKTLRKNYEEVIRHVDYDYMPLSGIQLRMREPCAFRVVGAWIEKQPKPDCVVHDPDPSIFPRRDARGNILHPKMAPDVKPTLPPSQKT